jgi:hypothetical protein
MARAPKASTDTEINVRLEIVKTLVGVEGFLEMDAFHQAALLDKLSNYVLTGKM